jgi:hypothetical protein
MLKREKEKHCKNELNPNNDTHSMYVCMYVVPWLPSFDDKKG